MKTNGNCQNDVIASCDWCLFLIINPILIQSNELELIDSTQHEGVLYSHNKVWKYTYDKLMSTSVNPIERKQHLIRIHYAT